MSHILNFKSKYSLEIEVDKQLIFDGISSQVEPSSFVSTNIKLFNEKNQKINLSQENKDEIITAISKIRIINGY